MLKQLIDWLFAKEDEPPSEVKLFDFTTRGPGNDITLRVIGDGEYAEALVFLSFGDENPAVGDFIVVNLADDDSDENFYTFVVETSEDVSLGVSKLTLTRYEGAENEIG